MDLSNAAAFAPLMNRTISIVATRLDVDGVTKKPTPLSKITSGFLQGGTPGQISVNGQQTPGNVVTYFLLLASWTLDGYPNAGDQIVDPIAGTLTIESSQPLSDMLFLTCAANQWFRK